VAVGEGVGEWVAVAVGVGVWVAGIEVAGTAVGKIIASLSLQAAKKPIIRSSMIPAVRVRLPVFI